MADDDSSGAEQNGPKSMPSPKKASAAPPPTGKGTPEPPLRAYKWHSKRASRPTPAASTSDITPQQRRLFGLLAAAITVATTLVVVAFWIGTIKEPHLLSLPITEYGNLHYPANPLAEQDSSALVERFAGRSVKAHYTSQDQKSILQALSSLQERPEQEPQVVHISCLARVWEGTIHLLPGDARPDDPLTWLPLERVLESLCRDGAQRPKLLILDIVKPLTNPRLGIVVDAVANRLEAAVQPYLERGLTVLCPCSPGQVALSADCLQRSVFGHYVELGLRGWAAGYHERGASDRIRVIDLAAFVRDHVGRWATQNRGVEQTPLLLGQRDFELARCNPNKSLETPPLPNEPRYPQWLVDGWLLREEWWLDETYRLVPVAFRRLEADLLRAEESWRGGRDEGSVRKHLEEEITVLRKIVSAAAAGMARPMRLHTLTRLDTQEWLSEPLKRELPTVVPTSPWKEDELKKAVESAAKGLTGSMKLPKPEFPAELARAVFDLTVEDGGQNPRLLRFRADLLKKCDAPPCIETLYLFALAEAWEKYADSWSANVPQLMLRTVRSAEQAFACDPNVFRAFEPLLKEAGHKRQAGESLLFQREDQVDAALADLTAATKLYEDAHQYAELLERALRRYEAAMAFMPAVVSSRLKRSDLRESEVSTFQKVMEQTERLGRLLDQCSEHPVPQGGLGSTKEDLEQAVQQLDKSIDGPSPPVPGMESASQPYGRETVHQLLRRSQADSAGIVEFADIERELETPVLWVVNRVDLWKAGWRLSERLHHKTATLDLEDRERRQRPRPQGRGSLPDEARRASTLVRLSLLLAQLGGANDELARVRQAFDKGGANESVANDLRKLWADQLPKKAEQLLHEKQLSPASRLMNVLDPFDEPTRDQDRTLDPATQIRHQRASDYWSWLAEQYKALGERLQLKSLAERYRQVAEDYRGLIYRTDR
jgi:hypothetical protein